MVRTDRRLFRDYIVADRWAVMGHRVDLVHDVDVMSCSDSDAGLTVQCLHASRT